MAYKHNATYIMILLTGSTYSLIYFGSVSCKYPDDDPERKSGDSVVGRRVHGIAL